MGYVNEANIALWEPDITPPEDWLLPSILYQDKISTFAPLSIYDIDGLEVEQLSSALGNLYEPLSLFHAMTPPGQSDLLDYLNQRLPAWLEHTEKLFNRTGDECLQAWLRRVKGWRARELDHKKVVHLANSDIEEARERTVAYDQHLKFLDANVERLSVEVANTRAAFYAKSRRERKAEYESLAAALNRRAAFGKRTARERRRRPDPERDAAIRDINEELNEIKQTLRSIPLSPERQQYEAACTELAATISARKAARGELHVWRRELEDATRRSRYIEESWIRPWREERFDHWPPNRHSQFLDTIGPGKIYSIVFKFLATEAGMWVSEPADTDMSYPGTLVGPKWVISDVLSILAEWYCNNHVGWVPMSSSVRPLERVDREPQTPDELVTLGIRWVLPAPASASLAEARDFRMAHDEELRLARSMLSAALPDLRTIDELSEAISVIKKESPSRWLR